MHHHSKAMAHHA